MSTSSWNVKVTILTWLVKMTHKISCCSTLCRFMLKIVTRVWTPIVTKKGTQSQTKWILEFKFTTKRFVKITHGNIVASHTLVLATPRFELNWVSKACVSIFPSTHEVVRSQQIRSERRRRLVSDTDSRAELKTDLSSSAQLFRQKLKTKQHSKSLVKSSCAKKLSIYRLTLELAWNLTKVGTCKDQKKLFGDEHISIRAWAFDCKHVGSSAT